MASVQQGIPPTKYSTYTPHAATTQSALIYSGGGGGVQAFNPPDASYRFARIMPISGDIMFSVAGAGGTPVTIVIGSTRLSGSALEHFIQLPDNCTTFYIAGVSGTATFQLTWIK